jgi:hypothetical protein
MERCQELILEIGGHVLLTWSNSVEASEEFSLSLSVELAEAKIVEDLNLVFGISARNKQAKAREKRNRHDS